MTHMVDRALDSYSPMQGETSRPAVVQRIVQNSNGSFLWSEIVTELLKKENTLDAFLRALDKTPKGTFGSPTLLPLSHWSTCIILGLPESGKADTGIY